MDRTKSFLSYSVEYKKNPLTADIRLQFDFMSKHGIIIGNNTNERLSRTMEKISHICTLYLWFSSMHHDAPQHLNFKTQKNTSLTMAT